MFVPGTVRPLIGAGQRPFAMYGATVTNTTSVYSTITWNNTNLGGSGNGEPRFVVVAVTYRSGANVTGVTLDGSSMTRVTSNGNMKSVLFVTPGVLTKNTGNLVVSSSGVLSPGVALTTYSAFGVSNSTPVDTINVGSAGVNGIYSSLTGAALPDSLVIVGGTFYNATAGYSAVDLMGFDYASNGASGTLGSGTGGFYYVTGTGSATGTTANVGYSMYRAAGTATANISLAAIALR